MKIISFPKNGIRCWYCNLVDFTVTTPHNGDEICCPLCESFTCNIVELSNTSDNNESNNYGNYYCNECGVCFAIGCTHAINGCTDDVYYARLIYEVEIDNKTKQGMPIFNSINDLKNNYNKGKYKWICMCNGNCQKNRCKNASYKNYLPIKCECKTNLSNLTIFSN